MHITLVCGAAGALAWAGLVAAQDSQDAARLIAMEQEWAAPAPPPGAPTPTQKYMYDGPVMSLRPTGSVIVTSKTRLLENAAPRPSGGPNITRTSKRFDYHVELYGDTALISYRQEVTTTNKANPGAKTSEAAGCLDTFVKRQGNWYAIANACAPAAPAK